MAKHIVIDLGASSGRILSAGKPGEFREHCRFKVNSRQSDQRLRWDLEELKNNIFQGLTQTLDELDDEILSISCDSWSQDFVLLDENGNALSDPVCYRDELLAKAPELLLAAGIDNIPGKISTLHQLAVMQKLEPQKMQKAHTLLNIADYINYLLSGKAYCNYSMLTAGKLLAPDGELALDLLKKLNIKPELFAPAASIKVIGKAGMFHDKRLHNAYVISGVSHDTAAAFMAEPTEENQAIVILGTWAMAGIVIDPAKIEKRDKLLGITPDLAAYSGGVPGMWAVNSCIEVWKQNGEFPGFAEFDRQSAESTFAGSFRAQWSDTPVTPETVKQYFIERQEKAPVTLGDYGKALNCGIAETLQELLQDLQQQSGIKLKNLIVCGGGSCNKPLMQMLAELTRCTVTAGTVEATALGNLICQQQALTELNQ